VAVFSAFWTGAATFSSKQLLSCTHETEWTPFQTHCFSETLLEAENDVSDVNIQIFQTTAHPILRPICTYVNNAKIDMSMMAKSVVETTRIFVHIP
jgi:hypothetical protein